MSSLLGNSNSIRACPRCNEEFHVNDCAIVSERTGDIVKKAPEGRVAKGLARMMPPEILIGARYTDMLATRVCPHCQYHLPYNIDHVESRSLVVVGDVASGKSHYISALIRQLQEGEMGHPDQYSHFVCLTSTVKREYDKLLDTLFNKKQVLAQTRPFRDIDDVQPLIYELGIQKTANHPTRKFNIIFYDASGEDYADQERMVQFSRYVLRASAIIFLADPFSMPMIKNRLPEHTRPEFEQSRASENFNNIIQLFARHKGLSAGSRLLSVPVAITISKADLLNYLRPTSDPYYFSSNPKDGYSSLLNLRDLDMIDKEVRQIIYDYGDRGLLAATRNMNVHFFATSATGNAPQTDGTYAAIEPQRCLDPVMWALYKLGIIEAR
jgi:GTPase SAR1 family protein